MILTGTFIKEAVSIQHINSFEVKSFIICNTSVTVNFFMYRRPVWCTFHIAVDFLVVPYKGLCGWGGGGGKVTLRSRYRWALLICAWSLSNIKIHIGQTYLSLRNMYLISRSKYFLKISVLRIRNKSFGSSFGSGSGLKLVSDPDPVSDPDSNPGFESWSESWIRIWIRNWPNFFCYKIFTQPHLQSSSPNLHQLCDLATNKVRKKLAIYEDITHICILSVYSVPSPCRWTQSTQSSNGCFLAYIQSRG